MNLLSTHGFQTTSNEYANVSIRISCGGKYTPAQVLNTHIVDGSHRTATFPEATANWNFIALLEVAKIVELN